jgi:hypothetical protein
MWRQVGANVRNGMSVNDGVRRRLLSKGDGLHANCCCFSIE